MSVKDFIHSKLHPYSQYIFDFNPKFGDIRGQVWMAEDLSIDDGKGGIEVRDGNYYYTWDAAMRVAAAIKGWHLPTGYELTRIDNNDLRLLGIKILRSPKRSDMNKDTKRLYWTSDEHDSNLAYFESVDLIGRHLYDKTDKSDKFLVRLVKD